VTEAVGSLSDIPEGCVIGANYSGVPLVGVRGDRPAGRIATVIEWIGHIKQRAWA